MIVGVTGLLGAGKSAWATARCVEIARKRKAILASNMTVTAPGVEFVKIRVGRDGPDEAQLYGLAERCQAEARDLLVLLDEVGLLMPARYWASFPVDLLEFLVNSRKLKVDLWWISQDDADVEVSLRRRTQFVFKVRRYPSDNPWSRKRRRPWFLSVSMYRPGQVGKKDRRLSWSLYRWRRAWESWFDTDELVKAPARMTEDRQGRRSRAARAPGPGAAAPGAVEASPSSS